MFFFGEAQAAESRKDFNHKISVVLKELRKSQNNIKILQGFLGYIAINKHHRRLRSFLI